MTPTPVRRSYLTYIIVALVPSIAAAGTGAAAARRAWADLHVTSSVRVGTMALNALQDDLARSVDSLTATAQPTAVDTDDPAWVRVSAGDTVTGLRPRSSGVEVMVLLPGEMGDPPGTLRYAGAPLPPTPLIVARATGTRLSLYMNGRRVLATPDLPGPDTLPHETIEALAASPQRLAWDALAGVALTALDHPVGLTPSLTALVAPSTRPDAALPPSLLLVAGLLFLFGGLAGWIQLGASEGGHRGRASILVVSLVPVLTSLGFLARTDQLFQRASHAAASRSLARGLAVASALGRSESVADVRSLTGFHATRVRDGEVQQTSLGDPVDGLAALPSPPPSFTTAGAVVTSEGPSVYVALRLPGGDVMVTSMRRADARTAAFRRRLAMIAAVLGAWLLAIGWIAGIGRQRVSA